MVISFCLSVRSFVCRSLLAAGGLIASANRAAVTWLQSMPESYKSTSDEQSNEVVLFFRATL